MDFLPILGAVGLLFALRILLPLILIIFRHVILVRVVSNKAYLKKLGEFAVITGATDGIGKEYARAFARLGIKIVLMSRTQDRLDQTAEELRREFQVEVKTIQADFTRVDIYDNIKIQLKDLDVGILVNNVGMTQPHPCEVYQIPVPDDFLVDMIRCNTVSVIEMSRVLLPGMIERGRGLLINISSASALNPSPLSALYSSSKIFVHYFSRGLAAELKELAKQGKGRVEVHSVLPFFVLTKFIGRFRLPTWLAPDPTSYVNGAVDMIGLEEVTHGTLSHAIQGLITAAVPNWIHGRLAKRLYSKRRDILLAAEKD